MNFDAICRNGSRLDSSTEGNLLVRQVTATQNAIREIDGRVATWIKLASPSEDGRRHRQVRELRAASEKLAAKFFVTLSLFDSESERILF